MRSMSIVLMFAFTAICFAKGQPSSDQTPRVRPEIGIEEHLGAVLPLDLEFYDEQGT